MPPLRLILVLLVALSILRSASAPHAAATQIHHAWVLRLASTWAALSPSSRVVRRLRVLAGVRSATIGSDGHTIDIAFVDGLKAAVLPGRVGRGSAMPRSMSAAGIERLSGNAPSGGRRALLLDPFGSDLGVMTHIDQEALQLHATGFAIDRFDNADVTVSTMSTISSYDLVYMVTHSGVNTYGDAVLATGQQADPDHVDPALLPLIQEGSVMITGVAGSSLEYYGVRARYIYDHLNGTFPHNSLVFLNGCSVMRGSLFWKVLQLRGAATMVSWDDLAATTSDAPAGSAFFADMVGGKTVSQTIDDLQRSGAGVSTWAGKAAHLGFLGDGTLTLDGYSSATATPTPSATPVPTATLSAVPTSTPVPATPEPQPSASLVPAPALEVTLKHGVRAGRRQVIVARSYPRSAVRFRIRYPNGDLQTALKRADDTGVARYAYVQLPHKVRPGHRVVRVRVTANWPSGSVSINRTYRIL